MGYGYDSQRQKFYDVEAKFIVDSVAAQPIKTVNGMQDFVDWLLDQQWFKNRWPTVSEIGIEVRDGRRRRRAGAEFLSQRNAFDPNRTRHIIRMPVHTRNTLYIVHEVAHICADAQFGEKPAAHGREFVRTYVEMIGHLLGKNEQKRLKDLLKENRVKWHASKPKRDLTDEQREALRERVAKARAVKAARNLSQ